MHKTFVSILHLLLLLLNLVFPTKKKTRRKYFTIEWFFITSCDGKKKFLNKFKLAFPKIYEKKTFFDKLYRDYAGIINFNRVCLAGKLKMK